MSFPSRPFVRGSFFVLVGWLLAWSATAQGADARAQLDRFFAGLKTLRADFVQTVLDPNGRVVEESEGVMVLSRPGRFRLEYQTPYQQLYVADGTRVWLYDKDLEQVTVRRQDDAFSSAPGQLLSGEEPLEKNFRLKDLGNRDGYAWLELQPLAQDAGFERLRLGLQGDTIRIMEMVDGFGRTTRLQFRHLERNPKVDPGLFRFTPPPGVDVIGEGE